MRTRTPLRVAVHVCAATRSGVIATAFVAARVAAATGAKLETYPAPAADLPTGPFTVAVAQGAAPAQGSFVYITQQGGRAQSWTTFSFEGGAATVAVTPSKNWTTCVLRPLSLGLTPRWRGGVAVFTVPTAPAKVIVEHDAGLSRFCGRSRVSEGTSRASLLY